MNIKVKNIKGGEKFFFVQSNATVYQLKSLILGELGIPETLQKLLHKGRVLEDSKLLSEYLIKENDTVILMSTYKPENPVPIVASETPQVVPEAPQFVTENSIDEDDLSNPASTGTFNFLIGNPQFESIANIIRTNPREFENFIVQLETTNPELFDLIAKNKKEFIEFITGKDAESGQLQLSKEEFKQVKELMSLGFSAQDSLEAYLVSGKNKETAANLLFSGFN